MGLFEFFKLPDIHRELETYRAAPGAVLLDVRTAQEYRQGRLPGSKNVPLQAIDKVADLVENKDVPLFVYCYSGARSRQAVSRLQRLGYTHLRDMGGIAAYSGSLEV